MEIIFHSIVRNFQKANNILIFSVSRSLLICLDPTWDWEFFQLLELFIGMLFLAKILTKYGKLCFYYNVFTDAHYERKEIYSKSRKLQVSEWGSELLC